MFRCKPLHKKSHESKDHKHGDGHKHKEHRDKTNDVDRRKDGSKRDSARDGEPVEFADQLLGALRITDPARLTEAQQLVKCRTTGFVAAPANARTTFENLCKYITKETSDCPNLSYTAESVQELVRSLYSWLCVDPNGQIILPHAVDDKDMLSMLPEGAVVSSKRPTPSVEDLRRSRALVGFAEPFEQRMTSLHQILWDLRRADYVQSYLDNILLAIVVDKVNVTGAWAWAIFDNFEWYAGTGVRFGLQYVNFTTLERHPKASFFQLVEWFRQHLPASEMDNGTAIVES